MQDISKPNQFKHWLNTANPGATGVYHEGFLMADRFKTLGEMILVPVQPIDTVAKLAWWASEDGRVELTQFKLRKGTYLYMATKRKERRK